MTDQQLPDRNGDVIDDIAIALTRRGDLSDEHRAFYGSILDRFEGLTRERDRLRTAWTSARRRARQQRDALREAMIAETDRARRARDRYRDERNTARDERDRALQAARFGITDVQEAWLSAPMSDAARMLSEIRARHAADDLGDESLTQAERDRLWLLDMVDHLRAKHAEAHATSMRRGEQLCRAEGHLRRLTGSAGRSVETLAEKAARLRAAQVHVATPEGITPCGQGARDVTVTALIREATCLDCLRTLAQAPQDDLTETSQPADIAELRGWVERLDRDLSDITKAVTQRLAAVEERLSPPEKQGAVASERLNGRYRDDEGVTWEVVDNWRARVVEGRGGRAIPVGVFGWWPLDVVRERYGPLTPVTNETAGGAE